MTDWLDPVRSALDEGSSEIAWFVRDDDAGWCDEQLYRLIQMAHFFEVPIDIAAIPDAVSSRLARQLRKAMDDAGSSVAVHQHGFTHTNHETSGRKAEFGASRTLREQLRDIATGRMMLQDALGTAVAPIFTPPWNRCTADTAAALVELEFQLISRDASAPVLPSTGLQQLPVSLDWSGRRGARQGNVAWGEAIASCLTAATGPIGLMLHHAVMQEHDWRLLAELFGVLTTHRRVRLSFMAHCAQHPIPMVVPR